MRKIHLIPLLTAVCLTMTCLVSPASEEAEVQVPEKEQTIQADTDVKLSSYTSEHLPGASALYISGATMTFDDTSFYGAGYATDEDIIAQIPNQYGMCSVVLAAGQGTDVTLNNPVNPRTEKRVVNLRKGYHRANLQAKPRDSDP